MMKQEKKPFELKEVGEAVGKEFYLVVAGSRMRKDIAEEFKSHTKSIRRRIMDMYWGLKEKLSKHKRHKYEDIEGCLLEIVKRERGSVDSYMWGNATSITFEDGKHVGDDVEGVMEHYLFIPESARITENKEIILKGSANHFYISGNRIEEPLESKVTVLLDRIPEYKSSGTTMVL